MKAFLKLSDIGLGLLLSTAQAATLDLSLDRAERFANEAQKIRVEKGILGDFNRGAPLTADVFSAMDGAVSKALNSRAYQAQKIWAKPDGQIRVQVKHSVTGESFWMTSVTVKAPTASTTTTALYKQATQLVIEERVAWQDTASGQFVTMTRSTADRIEAGVLRGPFTLSVFGALEGNQVTLGTAATACVNLGKGFQLVLRGEVAETVDSTINVTQGSYRLGAARNPSAKVGIQVQKTWGITGLRTAAGVDLRFSGGDDFSTRPIPQVFLKAGKVFVDDRGNELATLDFIAVSDLGIEQADWMIALQGSFLF